MKIPEQLKIYIAVRLIYIDSDTEIVGCSTNRNKLTDYLHKNGYKRIKYSVSNAAVRSIPIGKDACVIYTFDDVIDL